jgi:hypothetical protein
MERVVGPTLTGQSPGVLGVGAEAAYMWEFLDINIFS